MQNYLSLTFNYYIGKLEMVLLQKIFIVGVIIGEPQLQLLKHQVDINLEVILTLDGKDLDVK